MTDPVEQSVPLSQSAGEWGRIGIIGFGAPLRISRSLRTLCVDERAWLSAQEFEDGVSATNLLPGPASTQLAIFCAWRLRGRLGALLGGVCFIIPGLTIILALSVVFLAAHPPLWVLGAAAGAGAAVPAVALNAALTLMPASWRRAGDGRSRKTRWTCYFLVGGASAATIGPYLVLVLVACGSSRLPLRGAQELIPQVHFLPLPGRGGSPCRGFGSPVLGGAEGRGVSYGGGFVIIPLMQHDAVVTYHWMTGTQFLNAVALGQITPGPVVQTVAVVGYAAGGLGGGLLAA